MATFPKNNHLKRSESNQKMKTLVCSVFLCLLLVQAAFSLDKEKDCKCRIQTSKKIVGGRDAKSAAYPFQVSLMLKEKIPVPRSLRKLVPAKIKIKKHFCGGMILNEQWVMTAGHCMPNDYTDYKLKDIRIGLGDNNLVKNYDEEKYAEIEKIILPDDYFPFLGLSEDIALIKLNKPLQFDKFIQPACLPTKAPEVYDGALKTIGWGTQNRLTIYRYTGEPEETRILTRHLKEADVFDQFSTLELCKKKDDDLRPVQNTLCTINANTNETACQGDSGGPLIWQKTGKAFVVGITKEGLPEELEGNRYRICTGQTAYTSVVSNLDWIKRHIGDDFCS